MSVYSLVFLDLFHGVSLSFKSASFLIKAGYWNEEELSRLGEITKKEFNGRPGILIREE